MKTLTAALVAALVLVPAAAARQKQPFAHPKVYESYLLAQARHKHVNMKCLTAFTYQVTCTAKQDGIVVMARYWKVGPHKVRECVTAAVFGTECKTRATTAPGV